MNVFSPQIIISIGAGGGVAASSIEEGLVISDTSHISAGSSIRRADFHWPNQRLLNALQEVEKIQSGMKPHSDDRSAEKLREARDGGMYGFGSGG